MATDDIGNAFVGGATYGAFDGNPYAGLADVFVASFDGGGVLRWSAQVGTAKDDYAEAIATDGRNVYVAGDTFGGIGGQPPAGEKDAFLLKFDDHGVATWSKQFGSTTRDAAWAVATDASGNVFVAGQTDGAMDGIAPAGSGDAFVTSCDAMGNKR